MEPHGPVDAQQPVRPLLPVPVPAGSSGRGPRPRTGNLLLLAVGVLLVADSVALVQFAPPAATAAVVTAPGPMIVPAPVAAVPLPPRPEPLAARRQRIRPVVDAEAAPPRRLTVEAAGIDTPLVGLRRLRDGSLEVPTDFALAGWYREGVKPGDNGPAVLVGHVDSYDGPAVFYRLDDLRKGDRVVVTRADGSSVAFEVYARETVPKDAFPTSRVYGDTDRPELRLLTCGGPFDTETKHYLDNVVVYAALVDD